MESLESKLDRLSPEQRREAEDFVDFLLSRSGAVTPPHAASCPPPPILQEVLPLLTAPASGSSAAGMQDRMYGNPPDPVPLPEPDPAPFHEIRGGIQDHTSDYMDYGQFERQPSPATDAVNKIKRKIVAREGQDKPRHLLDWVD